MHFLEEYNLNCIKASLFLSFDNFKNIFHYIKPYSVYNREPNLKINQSWLEF
jgi:hypothetical protein